ncbi:hypothetical protein GMB86_09455 [Terrilactibacillus sp. BCM23-1]|uniref:Uncharacterized protein n=1 Tax=Terrilactibacillus tamarindi TaxID=2599694 RepID=A0A6N8CRG4_9BACI|nr:hypothetical protein [Terrilactibacillus tamarindi]MTT32228.1 hypothetical protein [Terrilactibacillus tamarindi]
MSDNKKNYDNGNVILVASEPSKLSGRYTKDKMKQLRVSSQVVLKALNEINDTYPHRSSR